MTPISTHGAAKVSIRWPVIALAAVLAVYFGVLLGVDSGRQVFARSGEIVTALPVVLACSLASYLVRYARWRWLLANSGHRVPWWSGFLAYVAGFAFTASPGKVGELLRVRYFSRFGVPAARVVACFIFERLLDLLVLLAFACLLAGSIPGIGLAIAFVLAVLILVVAAARLDRLRLRSQYLLRRWRLRRLARLLRVVLLGVRKAGDYVTGPSLVVATGLGLLGWGIQCIGYAIGLNQLGVALPWVATFAVAPAAILIGAASMLPGGIATTEAATVVILSHLGVDIAHATLAAVALRLCSIWFAMLLGFAAVIVLERAKIG